MDNEMWIPIVGMMIPMVIAPVAIITKYLQQKRQWTHIERMRAIELGQVPATEGRGWPALIAIFIGAGVPVGTFFMAWMAVVTIHADEAVFALATVVSIAAIIAASKLTHRMLDSSSQPVRRVDHHANGKAPSFDPDAYDVASRRG
jgi:hypothetical protein